MNAHPKIFGQHKTGLEALKKWIQLVWVVKGHGLEKSWMRAGENVQNIQ